MDSNLIPYQPVISDIKNLITVGQNSQRNSATAIPAEIFTITVNFTIASLIPRF